MTQVSIALLRRLIRTLSYAVSTHETKYVVQGGTLEGIAAEVVAKVSHTGRLFIITVYVL